MFETHDWQRLVYDDCITFQDKIVVSEFPFAYFANLDERNLHLVQGVFESSETRVGLGNLQPEQLC